MSFSPLFLSVCTDFCLISFFLIPIQHIFAPSFSPPSYWYSSDQGSQGRLSSPFLTTTGFILLSIFVRKIRFVSASCLSFPRQRPSRSWSTNERPTGRADVVTAPNMTSSRTPECTNMNTRSRRSAATSRETKTRTTLAARATKTRKHVYPLHRTTKILFEEVKQRPLGKKLANTKCLLFNVRRGKMLGEAGGG